LDLHVEHHSPQDLNFEITVHDCDMKGGNHLLIGTSEVNALDLITTSSMSVPIKRDLKVKGFLQVSHFQLSTDKQSETLMDDESIFSVVSSRTAVAEAASEEGAAAAETVATSIQFEHPESPDVTSRPPRLVMENLREYLRVPPSSIPRSNRRQQVATAMRHKSLSITNTSTLAVILFALRFR
jgi:hypothetical protein